MLMHGTFAKYKAQLVAQGFFQLESFDYGETFFSCGQHYLSFHFHSVSCHLHQMKLFLVHDTSIMTMPPQLECIMPS
jgi:hypothetical protein